MAHHPEYDLVPPADDAREVDPHWLDLQRGSDLPSAYLPSLPPAQARGWRRAAVWVLIAMLVSATSAGICLTYGPAELFRLS